MTLVVGIIAKDGVVLASDTRMTSEINTNDKVDKIIKLDDHIAVGVSGDGTLGIHMIRLISSKLDFEEGIIILVEKMRELLKAKFEDYYSSNLHDPPKRAQLTFLVIGYNKSNGIPEAYELCSDDNFIPRPSSTGFDCIGIPYIAEYLLNRFYEREITSKQAEVLASFCISETESQSHQVGGDIKVATFSSTNKFTMLTTNELLVIKEKCQGFHKDNKAKFYPETE